MPKVSVCLPTYNGEKFLEEAIDSILNQTFQDFELIICDDQSQDRTPEILSFYANKSNKIRYFRNPRNLGIFRNWNECIKHSSGEYITVFGQDDVMLPRNIEARVSIFDAYPSVGLVAGSVNVINGEGLVISSGPWSRFPEDKFEKGRDWLINNAGSSNNICCPFVFLRRKSLERVGGEFNCDYAYTSDFEMWLRIALISDLYFLKETVGCYRLHGNNETYNHGDLTEIREILLQSWSKTIDALYLSETQLKEVERQALSRSVHWILYSGMIARNIKSGNLENALEICHLVETWRGQNAEVSQVVKWFAEFGVKEIASSQESEACIQKLQEDKSWLEAKCKAWIQTASQTYKDLEELRQKHSELSNSSI